ncbi:Trm112 family protein [Oryzomonas japonica]|uniref:Trm112 family protein n=1 Tax=Oryzomonas japonica TaxID=2603858 RepID=A0A7J4ZQQ6_9BACT|nr:Trm112 family protein [Oryzomonas japonica]KAB0665139.1 Trm112 family protein [Oryzomonas japonica]
MLPEHLQSILACPICTGKLSLFDKGRYMLCRPCGVKFPIREGIPVLLTDEAEAVTPEDTGKDDR